MMVSRYSRSRWARVTAAGVAEAGAAVWGPLAALAVEAPAAISAAAPAMAAALRRCRRRTGVAVLEVGRCGVVSWMVMVETVLPAACGTLARGSQALTSRLGGVGSAETAMDFRILGPLEVRADGRAVALTGASQRAVLAVLALHANEPVSGERLALALWGEDAGARSVRT